MPCLVVKKGSKTRSTTSGCMPAPLSPMRTATCVPAATASVTISSRTRGWLARKAPTRGAQTRRAAVPVTLRRSVPLASPPRSRTAATASAMPRSAGSSFSSSSCPASVGTTARVVRLRRRMPKRSSSDRSVWLSAEAETPSSRPAALKLRCRATTAKKLSSPSSLRPICIVKLPFMTHRHCPL